MKYKVITLNKKNITDFALERNKLMKKTKDDWIFFVDSDEVVSPKLKNELDKLNPKTLKAFCIKRKNFFLGQFVGTDNIIRLVKKDTGVWKRLVHETWNTSQPTHFLKNYLVHNTANNLFSYLEKINKYSTLHASANRKEGKKSNIFKIIFFPIAKFIQTLIKSKNVVFSIMASLHSFLSWSKLYLNQK